MAIEHGLITAGGIGSRLQKDGIIVPLAKSFIEVEGKPILYWSLKEMFAAGIKRLVVTAETPEKLKIAGSIVEDAVAGHDLQELVLFHDQGLGANGLPYHTKDLLDAEFFFQFGHNLTPRSEYDELRRRKTSEVVVYSGFEPNGYSNHPIVTVDRETGLALQCGSRVEKRLAVAAPFILDHQYASDIPNQDFRLQG